MFMMFAITGKSSLSRFTTFNIDFTQLTAPLILSPKKNQFHSAAEKKNVCIIWIDIYNSDLFIERFFCGVDIDDIIEQHTF